MFCCCVGFCPGFGGVSGIFCGKSNYVLEMAAD
jgi:hypothetical protein